MVGPAQHCDARDVREHPHRRTRGGQIADEGVPAVKVASFNVLNYFTTLGDANDDNVGDDGCTAFRDRDGDGNSVSSGCDQRGAWDPEDLGASRKRSSARSTRSTPTWSA